jgi:hypothetical protein
MKVMKHCFIVGLVIGAGLFAASCTTFQASGLQMGLDSTKDGIVVLGDFTTKTTVNKFLGSSGGTTLFNLSSSITDEAVASAVQREILKKGGTAAINIEIKYGSNPIQWILNAITFNIWAPATATISGTVIKEK